MIIGHERVVLFLKKVLTDASPIHGFLFFGPSRVGKRTTAEFFVRGMLCAQRSWGGCGSCEVCKEFTRHSLCRDFLSVTSSEGRSIGIKEVRDAIEFLSTSAHLASKKVILIDDADELTPEAQNAFLKILEEPTGNAVVILVTSKPGRLFETVRSRLVPVRFHLVSTGTIAMALGGGTHMEEVAAFSLGRIGQAFEMAHDERTYLAMKERARAIVELADSGVIERLQFAKDVSSEETKEMFSLYQIVLRERMMQLLGEGKISAAARLLSALRISQWAMIASEDTSVSKRLLLENVVLSL
ncbi:MAG: AAA family ATPase [Parcubacteria group bacterium]|nr:AAA family ATPase [Parcubacteria group bacterium]